MSRPPIVDERRPEQAEPVHRTTGAWIGILSAAVALGAAELLAVPFGPGSSPIVSVGGMVVDATPEWLKSFAIRTFGANDKLVLLAGIVVVLTLLSVVLGIASMGRPRLGIGALTVLGAIGAAAAFSRPANGVADALPSVAGAGAGMLAFLWLREAAGLAISRSADPQPAIAGYDRRRFLRAGIAVAAVAAAAGGLGRVLASKAEAVASRAGVRIPPASDAAPPPPAAADLGVPGVAPFLTPNDRFYRVDTTLFVPAVEASTWTLRVHGMVDRELSFDYRDLLARPLIERDVTIACVSNEVGGRYIGNARWTGARLADVLGEAGVHRGATQLVSRSVDGFTIGTPTAIVMDGRDAMLAVAMNGEPLPLEHGFPVRMIVPGLYGYVSATKWLVDLELTTLEAYDAYWVQRGWAKQAPIKTESRIDTPRSGDRLPVGQVVIAGVAWAQHRGIDRVQVRIDEGPWNDATLAAEDTIDTWRQWRFGWMATPGGHAIAVRATDGDGVTQTAERATPFPDGATGYHTVLIQAS